MNLYFNLFKVKFAKLDELIEYNIQTIPKGSSVNLFINMESILSKLSNPKVDEYLRVAQNTHIELISEILNLASHYRLYFTKNKINSNIYMYMQYPFNSDYKNRLFNKDYRKYYYHTYNYSLRCTALSNVFINTIPLTKIIFEYIEGIYFIESGSIENSIIPKIIMEHTNPKDFNFILTSSVYDYQFVNYNTNIIVSKQDDSVLLTQNNIMEYIKNAHRITLNKNISPYTLPFILSIVGSKHRNIYNIKGYGMKKVFKLLERALDDGLITDNTNNINLLISIIKAGYRDIIIDNFHCTDIDFQYNQLTKKDIHDVMSQCIDKFDNVSLKKLNDEFFINSPINLMELTSRVNVNSVNKPKVIFK